MVTGFTIVDITGHQHQLKGWTSPSEGAGAGHAHEIDVTTLTPAADTPSLSGVKSARAPAHTHTVKGVTTPL